MRFLFRKWHSTTAACALWINNNALSSNVSMISVTVSISWQIPVLQNLQVLSDACHPNQTIQA